MKIFSEKTNKYYSTVDECVEAEKKYDEEVATKEAKKKEEEVNDGVDHLDGSVDYLLRERTVIVVLRSGKTCFHNVVVL